MARNERKGGLGRGLGSLLDGAYESPSTPSAPVPPKTENKRVTIEINEEAAVNAPVSTRPAYTGESVVDADGENNKETQSVVLPQDNEVDAVQHDNTTEVDINLISPNPDQPRTLFDKEEIEELAASIEKDGLLQPLLVRPLPRGTYQIVAGERRWQASLAAGLKTVPVRIRDVDDDQALELALIENIQRSDLNPIEEAYGYKKLMERKSLTQAEVAQVVSKGRSTVANALRLLDLPEEAQQLLFEGRITAGHARAILSVPSPEGKSSLTQKIIENEMSVRETENLARLLSGKERTDKRESRTETPVVYKKVAKALKDTLGTGVKVKSSKGRNKIEIEFTDEEDLKRLFMKITGESEPTD